ncbi:MAG: hypothetical protein WC823_07250 [Parcubacteria group bacterium]|jgi:hypothetical protein
MKKEDNPFRIANDEEIMKAVSDDSFLFYVGMISPPRPGVVEFITYVEHQHYAPGTERNKLYNIWIIQWHGITWALMGVPLKDEKLIEVAANLLRLRIADGVPTVLSGGKIDTFPISRFNVYALENSPGHPVYQNDPTVNEVLRAAEEMSLQAMHDTMQKK